MKFWSTLLKVLPRHPLRGLGALYWQLTGRRVRARNRLRCIEQECPSFYQTWIRDVEGQEKSAFLAPLREDSRLPRISILLFLDPAAGADAHSRSLQSVIGQTYPEWEAVIVPAAAPSLPQLPSDARIRLIEAAPNAAAALEAGIRSAQGKFILPLRAGDALAEAALWHLAAATQGLESAVLYGDEDELDARGRRARPWFKPEWNEEKFLAQDYISASCMIRTDVARNALPVPEELEDVAVYALLLRLAALRDSFVRVPHVLCHRDRTRPAGSQELRRRAVERYLEHTGSAATTHAGAFDSVQVRWPLPPEPPLVSVIVPTRDNVRLLATCLRGVLHGTGYPNIEVLVVDNASAKVETRRYFREIQRDPRVRVLRYPGTYNYSAINNFAAREARGSYVCLLNNDTEILHEDWLCEMMRHAVRPHVGAVGAKLLYADRRVQHAGVIVGIGGAAGHAHRFLRNDDPGYFNHAHVPQYVSAVTAACLVVEKRKLLEVGALDEKHLAVAFNDVDLCLKLGAAGWRNVYTPHAVLIHHESKSRRRDSEPSQRSRYQQELRTLQDRWRTAHFSDPCHHPNLSRSSETFRIRAVS